MNIFKGKTQKEGKSYALPTVIKNELIYELRLRDNIMRSQPPVTELIDKGKKVYELLELDNLGFSIETNNFQVEQTFISRRQMHTMKASLLLSVNGDIYNAFHELQGFIYNYGSGTEEPFSTFEKFCIKQMLDCIFHSHKKNNK